jgi:hypothetical protein
MCISVAHLAKYIYSTRAFKWCDEILEPTTREKCPEPDGEGKATKKQPKFRFVWSTSARVMGFPRDDPFLCSTSSSKSEEFPV